MNEHSTYHVWSVVNSSCICSEETIKLIAKDIQNHYVCSNYVSINLQGIFDFPNMTDFIKLILDKIDRESFVRRTTFVHCEPNIEPQLDSILMYTGFSFDERCQLIPNLHKRYGIK